MRVLFVCGFNAPGAGPYAVLRAHFAERRLEVEYFTYTWVECAESVYARLSGTLRGGGFDALVAYSMGATLVTRYLTCNPAEAARYTRVVLCMPLIAPTEVRMRLVRCEAAALLEPLVLALLAGVGSLLPSSRHFRAARSVHQVLHVYRHWLDDTAERDAAELLERPNVHVLYALCETLTPVPWRVLSRAANLHIVHGGHAVLRSGQRHAAQFLAALDAALGIRLLGECY
jgi:hypothetical protein